MPERINKLQPDRTIHLRGFDHLGAGAAVHSASPTGFKVSGIFRDAADFAVLILYDADNFYEHPRLKYLPDTDFDGLTLQFDVAYQGLMPLDCRKFATIDWPSLNLIRPGSSDIQHIRLADPERATIVQGANTPASGEFQISGENLAAFDRLTLWYQNLAFDYIVPGKLRTEFPFFAAGVGTEHTLTIGSQTYTYLEKADDASAAVAGALVAAAANDPNAAVSIGAAAHTVKIERKLATGVSFAVGASGSGSDTLWHVKAETVCNALAAQINGTDYATAATPFTLVAQAVGTTLRISTVEGGFDANFITIYAVNKTSSLSTSESAVTLSGGSSNATLRVTLNFAQLGIPQIRQMWLTFAPLLTFGTDYTPTEWQATFSNWQLSGPDAKQRLLVAGPGSVRVNSSDPQCVYAPEAAWINEQGFYTENFARGSSVMGASITAKYYCDRPHDLWVGTALYPGRALVGVTVDGVVRPDLDTNMPGAEPQIVTRRRLATGLAAGDHKVVLTLKNGRPFFFDYLEAVVAGEAPEPLPSRPEVSPALDYSTDHTYKLPPSRILWSMERLGFRGPLNEYIGVFWWNQRKRIDGMLPRATVTFGGEFQAGDGIFLNLSGQSLRKAVLSTESTPQIINHFAYIINSSLVGVYATVSGNTLTVYARSAEGFYRQYQLSGSTENVSGSTGSVSVVDELSIGDPGTWQIDVNQHEPLNRGARDWHADFYFQARIRNLEVTTACSMELVYPPGGLSACYSDDTPVATSVGFGNLVSTHCAFNAPTLAFQKKVFSQLAQLMHAAGLRPRLQFGEFSWWYFTNGASMAYYDADTKAAAQTALGRPLHIFQGPNEDPAPHMEDAIFLRNRLRDYVSALRTHVKAAYPNTIFEVLFPYDVNHPTPSGIHMLGGRLNRLVNLPVEWESKAASGLDRFKLEALDFGAWSRNLDLVYKCVEFPFQLDWPKDSIGCMVPVFRGGYPWEKEVARALELGSTGIHLWAFDHVCLYAWPLTPQNSGKSMYQG